MKIKYILVILIAFIISITLFSVVDAKVKNDNFIGKTIYLDAGHGGKDPGTTYNEVYEKELNLIYVKKIKEELEKKGAVVKLTRDGDYDLASPNIYLRKRSDLANRAKLINDSKAHLYLSIHMNYYKSSKWSGPQVFYNNKNKFNKILAEELETSLKQKFNNARDSKYITDQYLYDHVTRPGVLIEIGFLSNPNDRYLLKQEWFQRKMAQTIVQGLSNYLSKY